MIKNLAQAAVCVVAATALAVATGSMVPVVAGVIFIALAAFERNRTLSCVESTLGAVGIITACNDWFVAGIIVFGLLAVENLAFILAPARGWIMSLDGGGGGEI